jgi:excisionase family DNA binding protein
MSEYHKRDPIKQVSISEELLTIDELAKLLKVQKGWIYGRTRDRSAKTIPHFKVGKYLRFSLPEVKAWLQEQHRGWQQER